MRKAEDRTIATMCTDWSSVRSPRSLGELTNPDLGMAALADGVADALREQGEHHLLYGFFLPNGAGVRRYRGRAAMPWRPSTPP